MLYTSEAQYEEIGRVLRENMGSDEPIVLDRRFRRKSGDEFVAEVNTSYLWESAGSVLGSMAVVRDVTGRGQPAAEARQSIEDIGVTVQMVEQLVGEHAERTGEGKRAPDMPLAHEGARKTESARRAALRAGREQDEE